MWQLLSRTLFILKQKNKNKKNNNKTAYQTPIHPFTEKASVNIRYYLSVQRYYKGGQVSLYLSLQDVLPNREVLSPPPFLGLLQHDTVSFLLAYFFP